ncbi:hypothetical protein FQA39_LY12590 [Lamprigera yunnana]|nr:hypothetical protein FQA39_LY12590 [Lamprigera yunnana]
MGHLKEVQINEFLDVNNTPEDTGLASASKDFSIMMWVIFLCVIASAHSKRQLYVREAKMGDQTSESSSYQYTSNSFDPNYVKFNNLYYPSYLQNVPQNYENFQYYYPDFKSFQRVIPNEYSYWPTLYKDSYIYGLGNNKDLDRSKNYQFVHNNGDTYDNVHHTEKGKEGNSAYKNVEEFDKGLKSKHDSESHQGYYNTKGGDKDGHYESSTYFTKDNEADKGSKGGSYSESSGHKKGSKTTGYHKVYNKDEYKKDRSFYDESDRRGNFNKYASSDSNHERKEGDFEKGGRSNYGFNEANQGENGSYDKGHYNANNREFSDQQGKDEYQENNSNYKEDNEKNNERFDYNNNDKGYYE